MCTDMLYLLHSHTRNAPCAVCNVCVNPHFDKKYLGIYLEQTHWRHSVATAERNKVWKTLIKL